MTVAGFVRLRRAGLRNTYDVKAGIVKAENLQVAGSPHLPGPSSTSVQSGPSYLQRRKCRNILQQIGDVRAAPLPKTPVPNPALSIESLGRHYVSVLELGVALEAHDLSVDGDLVAHHFRRLTCENAMKFGELAPSEGRYTWARADAIADFARQHGMRMTGHTLLWHRMQPPWLFCFERNSIARETLIRRLREHIFCLVERYADVVDNWDVVNEAISDRPGEFWRSSAEGSSWYEVFDNADFVELAFRFAAEAVERFAPNTALYYNDYEIERPEKRAKVVEMVRQLRARGVKIDGVGIQGHVNLLWPSTAEFGATIKAFAAEDLLVKVSELDVSVYTEDDRERMLYQPAMENDPDLELAIAERYADLFRLFIEHSQQLTSIVLWGINDARTWLNYFPIDRPNYPLLFDRSHQPKQALRRLLEIEPRNTRPI